MAEKDGSVVFFTLNAQTALVKQLIEVQFDYDEVRFLIDDVLSEVGLKGWKVGAD